MNDGLLRVNFAALAEAGVDIQSAVNELDTKLAHLVAVAKPLVDTWEGKAQAAYHQRQQKWDTAATDLKNILRDIQGAVDRSAQDYATTEGNAAKRFS
ncbi:type VII secretion system ESX-1 WXG100 family target ESAT-6 [Amorphoplanes nipponensis]|uniref:ESAT-6-like protein n=1 Tax=Actinoplanes nipponensis TaxID=135950 RepID=A0A919JM85_9ACTN|nr:WXG100 family type VII secretion target [Actinoplanes nipponensis]GIE51962.1 6 kDa early secretory antigenic target [Actinoplanes nipponensis]